MLIQERLKFAFNLKNISMKSNEGSKFYWGNSYFPISRIHMHKDTKSLQVSVIYQKK